MARSRLRSEFPGCGVVGEEEGTESAGAAICWYVDPIDATHNYVRGIPVFATLLAVALDGELQLAVVSAPALRERWVAWQGGGAWRGAQRISVSEVGTTGAPPARQAGSPAVESALGTCARRGIARTLRAQ
jgi:histidinol-phosphatase